MAIQISKITNGNEKADIVKEVLLDLPEWFGLPESTHAYIDEARELMLLAATSEENILGFVTMSASSKDCAEIHAMGVKKSFHRTGIGKQLFQALEAYAARDYIYMQVKTVDEGHYPEYDQTIAFYNEMGFAKLEVFPNLWDEWNPCLVMVKKIEKQ